MIKSRFHRVLDAYHNRRIAVSTKLEEAEPPDNLPYGAKFHWPGLQSGIELFAKAPKFYFEEDCMQALMQQNDRVVSSLDAMAQAGVCRLPFPSVVAEYYWGGPMLVLLSESTDKECPFRCNAMGLVDTQQHGEILLLSPQTFLVSPIIALDDGEKGMRWKTYSAPWLQEDTASRAMAAESVDYWKPEIEPGLVATLVLLNTRGIEKIHVPAPEKLNKARAKKKQHAIHTHTVVRVGHVYDRQGQRVSNAERLGRKQPLGWRSGYTAVRWITARHEKWNYQIEDQTSKQSILVYVEPYLVNYDPASGQEIPEIPERHIRW